MDQLEVRNKYTNEVIAAVPRADAAAVDRAVKSARSGAAHMAAMPAYRRSEILLAAAQGLRARRAELAALIAAEAGKALKYSEAEVDRAVITFTFAAEEAKRISGETVPLDAIAAGEGRFGFYVRRPVGVVGAITPFNFPLNLVAHKVAPALAAGNSVVLKPAELTPLSAGRLRDVLLEAGLPEEAFLIINGEGETAGDALVTHEGVNKLSFTGSPVVGRKILSRAGLKKVTLELGNTGPVIVAPDADLELAARTLAVGAYYNSGQVCVSVQRIYGDGVILSELRERFVAETEKMVVGDPQSAAVDVGPMIASAEAERAQNWVAEARAAGASVLTGDRREGAVYWPTVLENVTPDMRVIRDEVFAPVASLISYKDFETALALAGDTPYGLQASIWTRDIGRILRARERLNFGGIIVNDGPNFRADHMPYGGNGQSGMGREGVKYAIEEMTNIQMVSIRA